MNICLIIIFNHRYDQVLPKLRKLYKNRFSNIKFLVPFYDGTDEDVITVYESSYQFQGFLTQGFRDFYNEKFDYYFFIADDMIISPNITEYNILDELGINPGEDFITQTRALNEESGIQWSHVRFAYKPFTSRGVNYKQALPSYEEALIRMKSYFGEFTEDYNESFFKMNNAIDEKLKNTFIENNKGTAIYYPLAKGYSDLFLIHKDTIKEFVRICGIFSAMNLFVEIAIPTALILTSKKIKVLENTRYKYILMWTPEKVAELEMKYNYNLNEFLECFDLNMLMYHPVKLSKWDI